MSQVVLKVQDLGKRYGRATILDGLSFEVLEGEFFGIIGPSGSGKSTLLRILAGVESATSGQAVFFDPKSGQFQPYSDNVVMVWQSLALFPHLSVGGNVGFGLKVRGVEKPILRRKVQEALQMVSLDGYSSRSINQLSGGEQQRVALARALIVQPRVLLLDEPLGALDPNLRAEVQACLLRIHRGTGITVIMVTHDQNEALTLSRRVAVLNVGSIEQLGQPDELIRHPRTVFVARFVGERNLYEGQVESCGAEHCTIRTDIGRFKIGRTAEGFQGLAPGCRLVYVIDVEHVRRGPVGENRVTGEVMSHSLRGSRRLVRVALPSGHLLSFETQASAPPDLQSVVEISWDTEDAYVLPASQQMG